MTKEGRRRENEVMSLQRERERAKKTLSTRSNVGQLYYYAHGADREKSITYVKFVALIESETQVFTPHRNPKDFLSMDFYWPYK